MPCSPPHLNPGLAGLQQGSGAKALGGCAYINAVLHVLIPAIQTNVSHSPCI